MSKALVFTEYGPPEVLHLIDTAPPLPGAGKVRVRVKAAGIQPFDCLFRSGAMRQRMPAKFPQRLGNDFAGIVDAVGEGVTGFTVGREVLGWAVLESYAEHVVVGVEQLVGKPAGMPWAEAGALPASGQTASTALAQLGVGKGDTVLIHAAAGGVGSLAVQLARARGATVIGTARERNHDYLRGLGAIPVVYGDGLVERVRAVAPRGVDAALVAVGSEEALHASLALVKDRQRLGTIAFHPLADTLGIRRISSERSAARLAELVMLHTEGKLRVPVQRTYTLAEAPEAHREMEGGHVRGKLVFVT
jgi:enoyl reductase